MNWAVVILALALAGCGGGGGKSSDGSGSVSGTLAGNSMTVRSVISGTLTQGADQYGVVVLSDAPDLCASYGAGHVPKNSQFLALLLGDQAGNVIPPPGVETLTVWAGTGTAPSSAAQVIYSKTDSTCSSIANATGASGSVTLTATDGLTEWTGTGDITMSSGAITIQFAPKACAALSTVSNPTCQ